MTLPVALLKRLAHRGIINKDSIKPQKSDEEIIAEDYDYTNESFDPDRFEYNVRKTTDNEWRDRMKRRLADADQQTNLGFKGCPNKYNIFHKCTLWCIQHWGEGISRPDPVYNKRHLKLLQKYPLPKGWKEVFDIGIGVHYFWNKNDDFVSWLPPTHKSAIITRSAAAYRKEIEQVNDDQLIEEENKQPQAIIVETYPKPQHSYKDQDRSQPKTPLPSMPLKKSKPRDLGRGLRRGHHREPDKLDPMDPAAYSNIPRGTWSAGLYVENEGKSGADSTVSGTLFQQRPYPSPGAILLATKKRKLNIGNEAYDSTDG